MADYKTRLEDAIIQAHEAGDEEGAQFIATELKQWKPKKEVTPTIERFMRGLRDPIDAGAQLLEKLMPSGISQPMNKLNNLIAEKTGLLAHVPQGGVSELIKQQEANYNAPEGIDFARLGGNIFSPANLAIASKLPMAGGIGQRMAQGALGGAGMSVATQPSYGDDFMQEKLQQATLGAVGGGVAPLVTGALGRMISPNSSTNTNVKLLRSEGVNPTLGQAMGGRVAQFEEKLQSTPIFGDMISVSRNKANDQFRNSVYNRALKPIDVKLPSDVQGRDAVNFAEQTLKNKYDAVLNKIGVVNRDELFNSNVNNVKTMVDKLMIPKAEKQKFNYALNQINDTFKGGKLTSEGYKMLESDLGSMAKKLQSSQSVYDDKLATGVKQLQTELKDMLERQAGDSAKDLQSINKAYAGFKKIQKASSSLGADAGDFTPAQFQSALKASDFTKGKGAFARGSLPMQDLSDAGKSVLTGKVPNSGTAERLLYGAGGIATGALNPAIPLGLLAGAGAYNPTMQRLLVGGLVNRPDFAPKIANAVKRSSPYLLPSLGLLGSGE